MTNSKNRFKVGLQHRIKFDSQRTKVVLLLCLTSSKVSHLTLALKLSTMMDQGGFNHRERSENLQLDEKGIRREQGLMPTGGSRKLIRLLEVKVTIVLL